jgi:hypothetical protein
MLEKVISGGQTGADQAGWRAAKAAGIATGGYMPKGFLAEDGEHPEFAELYGAVEVQRCGRVSNAEMFRMRTWLNVLESDMTLWFGDLRSPGGRATHGDAIKLGRPITCIGGPDRDFTPGYTVGWLEKHGVRVLNVAGNRESKAPGIGGWVEEYLSAAFRLLRGGIPR